jgi:hypothetical protein
MLRALCVRDSYPPGNGVIIGRATTADGSPAEGLRVEASWLPSDGGDREVSKHVDTRADGQFVICGVGLNRRVRVRASTRREVADFLIVTGESDVIPVSVALKARP